MAVFHDHADVAKLLLEHGADPNVRDKLGDNRTALHLAIIGRFKDVVELLLKKGANPNKRDINGSTPLHAAVVVGDPEIVELLLRHGANVNVKNNEGMTPLDYVRYTSFNSAAKIARILLKHGAEAADRKTPEIIDMLFKHFDEEKTAVGKARRNQNPIPA